MLGKTKCLDITEQWSGRIRYRTAANDVSSDRLTRATHQHSTTNFWPKQLNELNCYSSIDETLMVDKLHKELKVKCISAI